MSEDSSGLSDELIVVLNPEEVADDTDPQREVRDAT